MAFFNTLRVHAIVTVVTLVTLQLLNVGLDPDDHFYGYEDLSVKEIESCIDLVPEDVLKRRNPVKETELSTGARPQKPGVSGPAHLLSIF